MQNPLVIPTSAVDWHQIETFEVQLHPVNDEYVITFNDEWCKRHDWQAGDDVELVAEEGRLLMENKTKALRELRLKVDAMMDPAGW